jgi:uridine phosphorylase
MSNEGIIKPVKGKRDPQVGQDALMVMIPSELAYLARRVKARKMPFSDTSLYDIYQTEGFSGSRLTLSGPFLGAPHATIAMEKLIVLGARKIWALGWCGSLQHGLRTGHVVIPTGAESEEGTSAHYPIPDRPCESDPDLNKMLEKALEKEGLPFVKGPVWTTDAVYRETAEKVKNYQNRGILAVEMEMAALMTVAIYRSVSLAGLLVVSDELFDLKWRPGFSDPMLKKNSRTAGELLLRVAGG